MNLINNSSFLTVLETENVIENCVITVEVEKLEGLTETLLILMIDCDITSYHNHDISLRTRKLRVAGQNFRLDIGDRKIL